GEIFHRPRAHTFRRGARLQRHLRTRPTGMTPRAYDVLLPHDAAIEALHESVVLPPFGPLQIAFTAELSKLLTLDKSVRQFPELVALGFWMRPANIQRIANDF